MYRILFAVLMWALVWGLSPVYAETCLSQSSVPTFQAGQAVPQVCDTHGTQKVMTVDADGNYVAGGGGGGGDASAANQTTMIGHIDGIEGLIGTTNSTLSTIDGRVDGLETLIGTTNTTLTAIDGRVDGLEAVEGTAADAAATAGSTGSISAKLRTISGDIDAIKTAIQLLDNSVTGNNLRVQMTDSSGNEIVVPTAGLTSYTAAGASTNSTSVKGSAGTVYGYSLTNTTTTIYYLRMYNSSSAPTCNSATGYVATIPIPPASAAGGAGGREITKNIGQAFTTGIGFCVTGGSSSTDNTNAAAGVFVEILYK